MIVGDGLIACALSSIPHVDLIFFASGVADSMCVDERQFERERNLLGSIDRDGRKLVYISTCAVSGPQNPYFIHKKQMEDIARTWLDHLIVRLPPVVSRKSGRGLIRFLFDNIVAGEDFNVMRDAARRVIDIDDMVSAVRAMCTKGVIGIHDVASLEEASVVDIVHMVEEVANAKAKFRLVDGGNRFLIDGHFLFGGRDYIRRAILKHYRTLQ